MESYSNIRSKLAAFVSRYYKTQIVRGAFLFLAMGLLFWILLLTLEYFLWLGSGARLVLFLSAVAGTGFLLYRYVGVPLLYLLRVRQGLSPKRAASIIGDHFPEVGDRLVNLLDLASDEQRSELLLASIEQRSKALSPVPFQQAIDLKKSFKYARFVAIPVLVLGGIWVSGKIGDYMQSLDRVVHYDMAFEKPAPFRFVILNSELRTIAKQDYIIHVMTEGEIRPEEPRIVIDGKERSMHEENGQYVYTFTSPEGSQEFYFSANGVRSRDYTLEAFSPPAIEQFLTILDYPDYINRNTDTLKGTGNAVIPEGTQVSWLIRAGNAEEVLQYTKDTVRSFQRDGEAFTLNRVLKNDLTYEISTSNRELKDYERLNYGIAVVRDSPPSIQVSEVLDSLSNTVSYEGRAIDDYQIAHLELFYYEEDNEQEIQKIRLDVPREKDYVFAYDFPTGLDLKRGRTYNYYFLVRDNDALRGGKTAKSKVFSTSLLDDGQMKERRLEEQGIVLKQWDKTMDDLEKQEEVLKELERNQKEKNVLDYNDQKAIKDFLKSQQQQEALMEKFSKQLKEAMSEDKEESTVDRLLKERLERQEMEAKKNEKLLEQLRELADKIDKEELSKRLEEIGKRQQNNKRNLAQLLELTKKYYVTEKASKLSRDLKALSERQKQLAETDKKTKQIKADQEKIRKDFEKISKDLDELRKANDDLAKPLPIDTSEKTEEEVKEDLEKAREELDRSAEPGSPNNNDKDEKLGDAQTKQRSAAKKMEKMSEALQQSAMSGGGESMAEDAEMLRQILENLIIFSLKQEDLLDRLTVEDEGRRYSVSIVREEQQLRGLFEHVDDSLFALSLRQAEISEFVNEQITEVYYNIDSSLENLAEGQSYRAGAHQQAVLTAANNLADFLADILSNMQQSLAQGQGGGSPKDGFQLPDIIKGQQEIQGSMQEMGKESEGQQGEKGKGENNSEGEGAGKDSNGQNEGSEGAGDREEENMQQLYEIYKQQQMIRAKLEEQLKTMIRDEDRGLAERLARQMEDFERDLIENGITDRAMQKVNRIRQQLMKLENAAMEQGKKEERESEKATKTYDNPLIRRRETIIQDKGIIELLQRQALPLQEFYGEAVKRYFREND